MPFSATHFFRRRDTFDGLVPPVWGPRKSANKKLTKRAPFSKERNAASLDLSKIDMGNKASLLHHGPQPPRPRRPAATDLPNLTGLPIYQSFTAKTHPPTILDEEKKPPVPEKSPSRRSSISSKVWPLPGLTRGRSSERTATPLPRKQYSSSVDTAAPEKCGHSMPRYDRASHLAESYRALLPDMGSTGDDKWPGDPREPRSPHQVHQTLHHLGNRPLNDPPHRVPDMMQPLHSPGGPRPLSAASSSSLTAVDRDEHSPASSDGESATPTCPTACRRWSLDSEWLQGMSHVDQWPRFHEVHPHRHPVSYPNWGPPPGLPGLPRPPGRQRTSDDVGLQICADMLNAELRKALINKKDVSKLQFLLLIEAYEATLETCRKEISRPPLTRGGEGERIRKRHVREAVRILDNWLNSLYTLYDEEFGEDGFLGAGESLF